MALNLREQGRPKWQLVVPSAYDGTKLDCRFFHPPEAAAANAGPYRGAIVAPPYGPLGGSYDDPVVAAATRVLLDAGLYVATFNFRKPGLFKGNTSLSGNPEVHDYASVLACFTTYLQHVKTYRSGGYAGDPEPFRIVLAGYSYGSMIASRLPAARTVGDVFAALSLPSSSGKHLDGIAKQAHLHAYNFFHNKSQQDRPELGDPADQGDILITPHYLLISPLIGPVVYFVTPTAKQKPGVGSDLTDSSLAQNPSLALFGDADGFSSADRLTQWCEKLASQPDSRFKFKKFQDVDHFWHELGAMQMMQREVRDWINKVVLQKT